MFFTVLDADYAVEILHARQGRFGLTYRNPWVFAFLIVPALVALLGERNRPLVERINAALERVSTFLMPAILGVVGLALVADAVLHFASGKGLF